MSGSNLNERRPGKSSPSSDTPASMSPPGGTVPAAPSSLSDAAEANPLPPPATSDGLASPPPPSPAEAPAHPWQARANDNPYACEVCGGTVGLVRFDGITGHTRHYPACDMSQQRQGGPVVFGGNVITRRLSADPGGVNPGSLTPPRAAS